MAVCVFSNVVEVKIVSMHPENPRRMPPRPMGTRQNLVSYHQSISSEISITQNRIRDLIGEAHWQTDGEYKEAVLRRVLRTHLPESVKVGKGFVCYPGEASRQIDLLLVDATKPTLFREGDVFLVTPDAVKAVVEVKTTFRRGPARGEGSVFSKLANTVQMIRANGNPQCQAGLFAYADDGTSHEDVLRELAEATEGINDRAVNWVALGKDRFIRYWNQAPEPAYGVTGSAWHLYEMRNLAFAYFVGNVVFDAGGQVPRPMQYAWFPIEGGKETLRQWSIPLDPPWSPNRFTS